jgi:Planctomycete cytochrome C
LSDALGMVEAEVLMKKTLPPLLGAAAAFVIVATIGMVMTMDPDPACAAPARQSTSFSEDILPLLKWRCGSCHTPGGAGYEKSGLDLNSYDGVMKGTKFGPMVVARDPESSNLMLLLDWRVAPAIRMPHGQKKLSICDRDAIRAWIREGAKNN